MGIPRRDVAVSLHPLFNSGIPGIMGILGRDVAVSLHPLWNSGIPGIMGILGRDVIALGPPEFRELWEEMWLCRYTPCGIPEFRELWEF